MQFIVTQIGRSMVITVEMCVTLRFNHHQNPSKIIKQYQSKNPSSDYHVLVDRKISSPYNSLFSVTTYLTTLITSKPSNTSVSIATSCSIFVGRNTFGAMTVAKFELSILLPNRTTDPVIGDRMSSACFDTVPKNFNSSYSVSRCATGSNCIRCEMASNCKRLLRISTTTTTTETMKSNHYITNTRGPFTLSF